MNNKNCGCQAGNGFVPVSGNWDFNMDACQPRRRNACEKAETGRQRGAREDMCGICGKARNACTCARKDYAKEEICSICGRARHACTCGQQTYARNDCACTAENNTPACVMKNAAPACGGAKKGVGMVRVTKQSLGDIFDNGRALKAGTLFPELHKPMNGYWPCDNECGDGCQQAAFAAWEVRLYLNTHPEDTQARALLNQLIGDCCEPNYATTFLPEECSRWAWTDDPWPWNIEANCRK